MDYTGLRGVGAGALALVEGKIAGLDVSGGQYVGSYREADGYIHGDNFMSLPYGGTLVTGVAVPAGLAPQRINFSVEGAKIEGEVIALNTSSGPVNVRLTKVSDL